ncbi:peptidoglycan-binding protein [Hansschlegelia quercus]|uniref:Peptidoglycan-binding protein n=1 Tax=Hansschlegelia quercus TaxID=2528245 RepID=A0A4Q9GAB8_9HYPH|nr:peptidoglycan-binding domain-containing protein [Hansschlegelia quercus]TBN47949.1 peptidoglycan-binding protein [Hansschlegelia quercus]
MPKRAPRYEDLDEPASGALSGLLARAQRRPVDTLAVVLAMACTGMVFVNALALQSGRHPAPLFGEAAPAATPHAAAPQRNELVAQVQQALTDIGYYDGAVDGLMGARTGAAIRAFEQAQKMEPTGAPSDRLLAAALVAPPRRAASLVPAPAPAPLPQSAPATTGSTSISAPKLMAVQKALAKLGYGPVSVDGKMGAGTRAAIINFERDRNMPETGEPTPPVLRALQATTGAPLQ